MDTDDNVLRGAFRKQDGGQMLADILEDHRHDLQDTFLISKVVVDGKEGFIMAMNSMSPEFTSLTSTAAADIAQAAFQLSLRAAMGGAPDPGSKPS